MDVGGVADSLHERVTAEGGRDRAAHERARTAARAATFAVLALLLAGCAAGGNPEVGTVTADGTTAGFWLGLWHGVIAPVTFVISLVTGTINVYEVHNAGNWYDAGFMLGLTISLGGGSSGATRSR